MKSPDPTVAWKLLAYFTLVMLGAALLTPLLFWAGRSFAISVGTEGGGITNWVADALMRGDFNRYFNRAVLITALTLVFPFVRWAGFERNLSPVWSPISSGLRQCLTGFFLASALLLLLGWGLVWGGAYKLKPEPLWTYLSKPLIAAVSVGFIEEIFFRGALLGLFLKSLSRVQALVWCTFLFAIVHFLKPPESFVLAPESVTWLSGFSLMGQILRSFSNFNFLIAEFLTLFAVGWVLAALRMHTGRLWTSIGLHAGWVFGLKYFSALTFSTRALKQGDLLPWIGTNLKVGLFPLAVVLMTGWIVKQLTAQEGPGVTEPDKIRLQVGDPRET